MITAQAAAMWARRVGGAINTCATTFSLTGCLALMLLAPGASAAGDLPRSIAEAGAFSEDFIDNVRPVGDKKGDGSYEWARYNAQWQRYRASYTCWAWTDGCNVCSKAWFSNDVMCTLQACPETKQKFKCLLGF